MLDVIGAGNPDYRGQDWADVWANSPERRATIDEIARITESARSKAENGRANDRGEFAMPRWRQVVATTKRSFVAYWRTPNYAVVCRTPVPVLPIRTVLI
jgi:antibiotic biosynthesis monooxygenase (ABM) superfamily enzyme